MELWDAYDENFNVIEGVTLIRGERIPDGMYHLVCDVIVRHTDGSYLLMRRDSSKPFGGGMWEATAGGSALQKETPLECARRELLEETGIRTGHLEEIGRIREFHMFFVEFLCVTDCDKEAITLQEGETTGYRWVSTEELASMKWGELSTFRIQRFIDELKDSAPDPPFMLNRQAFV